ncbi:MAG: imidazolonepropionase [Acetobacteraceae bacterium]|nr:imidazolonepropionase [Acetobacteraceae bacterium]
MSREPARPELVIRHIGQLCTLAGPLPRRGRAQAEVGLVPDGLLAIGGGRILACGPTRELFREFGPGPGVRVVDAPDALVTPGLVDAHTHLVFGGWRAGEFAARLRGASYQEILARGGGILETVRLTREAAPQALLEAAARELDRFLLAGTTTVEAKSGYGLEPGAELKCLEVLAALGASHPVEVVPTFLGAHAVPAEFRGDPEAYVRLVAEVMLPQVAARGLARFCDVFCERGAFTPQQSRRILEQARSLGLGLKIHADEFSDSGGAALAAELGAVSADHLLYVGPAGMEALARSGTVAVLMPGTALFAAGGRQAPARRLIEAGVPVALATDFNPGTWPGVSLPLVMSLACLCLGLTPEEALTAATANAACALGLGGRLGSLEPGKDADLVVFDAPSLEFLPYRVGVNLVRTVLKRGRVVVEDGRRV